MLNQRYFVAPTIFRWPVMILWETFFNRKGPTLEVPQKNNPRFWPRVKDDSIKVTPSVNNLRTCICSWREIPLTIFTTCTPSRKHAPECGRSRTLLPFHHHQIKIIIRHRRVRKTELPADGHHLASMISAVVKNLMNKLEAGLSALHPRRVEAHRFL
jgi:hypothetical protein